MWYKKIEETLAKGSKVYNANYQLDADSDKEQVVDGWKWFDTEEEAYAFYNLPMPEQPTKRKLK